MAVLSASNIKELKSIGIETFNLNTGIHYRLFILVAWNGTESYYKRAGNAIRRMRDGNEPYFMYGIMIDGTKVLIAAH